MRDLREINLNDGGAPVGRPAPTADEIAAVEALVGRPLPSDYRELLAFSNGGHPEKDTFPVEIQGVPQTWGISRFFRIASDVQSSHNVVFEYGRRPAGWPREILPIANDGGGDVIGLDLSGDGRGAVILWIHDSPGNGFIPVAGSLEALIDSLEENPEYN